MIVAGCIAWLTGLLPTFIADAEPREYHGPNAVEALDRQKSRFEPTRLPDNLPVERAPSAPPARPRHQPVTFAAGKGVRFTSADDRFALQIGTFVQFLYTYIHDPSAAADHAQSLQVRRARLRLSGHAFSPHNKMFVHLAFAPRDLQVVDGVPTRTPIFDWYAELDWLRDLTVRIGQFRVPYSRERRVAISELQFIDRSLANFEFNLDRDVGMDVRSEDLGGIGLLRYAAGVFIGEGRDASTPGDWGLLYVGRFEVLPLGMFDDYKQSDLARRKRPGLSIGAAYAYLDEAKGNSGILGPRPMDGGTTDLHNVTADMTLHVRGLGAHVEGFWREGRRRFGDATIVDDRGVEIPAPYEATRDGIGWSAQLGWFLPWAPVEPAVRWSGVVPTESGSSLPHREELGAVVEWRIHGTALELSADYFRTWSKSAIDRGSDQLRIQVQAAF